MLKDNRAKGKMEVVAEEVKIDEGEMKIVGKDEVVVVMSPGMPPTNDKLDVVLRAMDVLGMVLEHISW